MDKRELIGYLERLDNELRQPTILHIYGSAACMLLDEPDRISLDIDVAGPYSEADESDLRRAAALAGLPVNPDENHDSDHIEWIGPLRLCLQPPVAGKNLTLWRGGKLLVRTGSLADLVSSKLIRYDETDRSDIQYLLTQGRLTFEQIAEAASRLPPPFASDRLVVENLENLRTDMDVWCGGDDDPA